MSSAPISIFVWFVAALVSPLLLWAALAGSVRRDPGPLHRIYPRLKAAAWIAWAAAIVALIIPLVSGNFHLRPWLCLAAFCSGIQLMHDWARRQLKASDTKDSPDGWWPTTKNS